MKSHKKVVDTENIEELKNLLAQKNRELEFEAALERVRAKTMAMHKTEELIEVIKTVFKQFELLEVRAEVCFINIHQADSNDWNLWVSTGGGQTYQFPVFPYIENPVFRLQLQARERGDTFYTSLTDKKSKDQFFDHFFKHLTGMEVPKARLDYIYKAEGIASSFTISRHATIALANYSCIPYTEEENLILQRIGNVFEQTYTRFLDLQKAEAQARESEIQLALERVRARTLAMQKSNELAEAASILFEQLIALDIKPIAFAFVILSKEHQDGEVWITSDGKINPNAFILPYHTDFAQNNFYQAWKNGESVHIEEMEGEALKKHLQFVASNMPVHDFIESSSLPQLDRLTIHAINFSHGFLGFNYDVPQPKHIETFKRFAKVFEQTYTRFLDLQKAETQAREAQIEAALERVRSRSMAMNKGDELVEVVRLLDKEILGLGIEIDGTQIITDFANPKEGMNDWIAIEGQQYLEKFHIPYLNHPILEKNLPKWLAGSRGFYTETYSKKEKDSFFKLLFKYSDFRKIPKERQEQIYKFPGWTRALVLSPTSCLIIQRYNLKKFTKDEEVIFQRMGKVFHQTYTRFLDLQKAEAQARDAQIEAALERIRSRAMGMQKGDELVNVVKQINKEIVDLGIEVDISEILTEFTDDPKDGLNTWVVVEGMDYLEKMHIPFLDHPITTKFYKGLNSGTDLIIEKYSKSEKNSYFNLLFKQSDFRTKTPKERQDIVLSTPGWVRNAVILKNSCLNFSRFRLDEFMEEEKAIFKRIGKVFEQAYTRFLDLQKAEAQAREAQIEAALERVRSASMAMHKSEELPQVALTFLTQIEELAIPVLGVALSEINIETNTCITYFADNTTEGQNRELIISKEFEINEFWMAEEAVKQMKSGKKIFTLTAEGERLELWIKWIDKTFSKKRAERLRSANLNKVFFHTYQFHDYSSILFSSLEPLPEEYRPVIQRLVTTFKLSYLRFLDLQKAEDQAREAQIQLALERVRARTMAMQNSEELAEVSYLLNKQVVDLGIPTRGCAFNIYNENDSTEWFSNLEGTLPTYKTPRENIFLKYYEAGQRGETLHIEEFGGERIKEHYRYLATLSTTGNSDETIEDGVNIVPEFQIDHVAYFKYGYLLFITLVPAPEAHDIFKRFAKEFEQTYTRFLDLQKAEAQAREAQIEAALERVRAQTMAMHSSEDVGQCIVRMFGELTALGVDEGTRFGIGILNHENQNNQLWTASKDGEDIKMHIGNLDMTSHPLLKSARKAWKSQVPLHKYVLEGDDLLHYYQMINNAPDYKFRIATEKLPEREIHYGFIFDHGFFYAFSPHEFWPDLIHVIQRFSSLFGQTYRRYLDLVRAEAQAREAQIETALERVRSRTMAMHKSEELAETTAVLFQQLKELGVKPERANIGIVIEDERIIEWWSTEQGGKQINQLFNGSIDEPTTLSKVYSAWKAGEKSMVIEQSGKELTEWLRYLKNELGLPFKNELRRNRRYQSTAFFSQGMILLTTPKPLSEEMLSLLPRFTKVFQQTYTRFLDLQKAEAQAREAQIEAALERVRAKAMAMHNTKDISEATTIVFNELSALGVVMERCGIVILHDETSQLEIWSTPMSSKDKKVKEVITGYLNSNFHPMIQHLFDEWRKNASYSTFSMVGDEVRDYYEKLGNVPGYQFPKVDKYPDRQIVHCFFFEHGDIFVYSQNELPEEHKQLLHRFTKVFSLTYKRYLDLKNAEAQAREAQIEAALERVRSKTMAMHNSDDVGATIVTLFDEVLKLGLDDDIRCGIGILKGNDRMETWSATSFPSGEVDLKMGLLDMSIHPLLVRIKNAWKSGGTHYADQMAGKSVVKYYTALNNEPDYSFHIDLNTLPKKEYHNSFSFSEGILFSFSPNPMSEEAVKVLGRFARVFGQTYTRYIDLLKAEAQAREAQIEAALERIRAKALAMQSSADLHGVSMVLREQMGLLGQEDLESSIVHLYNSSETLESWYTFRSTETNSEKIVTDVAFIPVNSCDYIKETLEKYHSDETEYTIVSEGKKLLDWYHVMVKVAPDTIEHDEKGKMLVPKILYYHHSKFSGGALLMISNQPPSEESKELQGRAAKVFNLAYQRFIDFQQAEERARESLKQASLDRVRGEIASMRSKDDLNRITPLLWKELTALGVPFIRCGVFIMDEQNKIIQSHLSSPDGKSLGLLNLPFEADKVGNNAVKYWRKGQLYKDHWSKDQFLKFMKKMVKLGRLNNPELYQGADSPPESLDLHFVPFKQGMLYVGNSEPLLDDELQLVQSLAQAFSIAYARYEDFTQLEEAKNQIETALGELKSTQTQLIHAEKMASLGELTAGIAHEIQNPLNFVNNFSDVSKELIEELKEERSKQKEHRDESLEDEILEDVIQNLEKINHHGQRASSIVKGMLEHSRTGNKKKELTDINQLADEYLRLSYHGLRAKDKSFNADFRIEKDENLPKVNVIAQDIGRVLLNLINNAFYAVSKKSKDGIKGYVPKVDIITKKNDKMIEITVQDNGTGIPAEALDKIFQPFFTTKPTGQGTGLGLSLSYDIITKGHDGHLEVETEEGLGTRFVVQLPINSTH